MKLYEFKFLIAYADVRVQVYDWVWNSMSSTT